jgi:hypothetical protein
LVLVISGLRMITGVFQLCWGWSLKCCSGRVKCLRGVCSCMGCSMWNVCVVCEGGGGGGVCVSGMMVSGLWDGPILGHVYSQGKKVFEEG